MIQRILIIISGLLVLGAIIAVIVTNKPTVSNKLLTVKTEYNYVYTDNKKINFKIYSNKLKHKIHFDKNISYVFLESEDEYQKFELDLVSITYSHEEAFLGDNYYAYIYSFEMPRLESNLLIEEAYLNFNLANSQNYLLPIGSFQFLFYKDVGAETYLTINSLYGFKQEGSEFSRLHKIIVEYILEKPTIIESITIDGTNNLDYINQDGKLEILIPYRQSALNHAPIILLVTSGGESKYQIIDNFQFFDDYDVLFSSGDLVNVIEAN